MLIIFANIAGIFVSFNIILLWFIYFQWKKGKEKKNDELSNNYFNFP